MMMQIGRVVGPFRHNGKVYESPNGVSVTIDDAGTRIVDFVTREPVQPRDQRDGGDR